MLTRRAFLTSSGIGMFSIGVAAGGGPSFLCRAAAAAQPQAVPGRRKVLVALFQRGAMDGLAAVVPLEEAARLAKLRPRLALDMRRNEDNAVLDLGVGFGLHPALSSLSPLWDDGALTIVHGVGSPDPSRSHFDAQDYMETGTPGRKGTPSGWLNRVCGELGHEASPFRAVALQSSLPRSLYGPESALAVADLNDMALELPGGVEGAQTGRGFETLYRQTTRELLHGTAEGTFEAVELLESLRRADRSASGVRYPSSRLGQSLRQVAALIHAEAGLEVAFVESGGWDTHVQQGAAQGTFAQRANDLAQSITAFWNDLGAYRDDVVLLTMTEFGRTVRENGSGGTDHGHGSCLFVVGGGLAPQRVHSAIESLDRDALYQGRDLPVTTDFRSVFASVAGAHLGVQEDAKLFPGWTGSRLPLFTTA